jgi:hypothetical protein
MAAPVIQIKRGLLSNLPGLRAGEPGFTTDSYDLYVGIDSTTNNNKFFGSHRYWSKETTSKGSGVNLVEGTTNGNQYLTLKAPDSLSGIATYQFPDTTDGSAGDYLKLTSYTAGIYALEWAAVPSGSFTLAAENGTPDIFTTGETLTFAAGEGVDTTVSDNQILISGEAASTTNAGIASYTSDFYFVNTWQVGVATASTSVKGLSSFNSNQFTVSSAGAVSITGVAATILNINAATDLANAIADTDEFVVYDASAGSNVSAAATHISGYVFGKVSGDVVISNTGTATIQANSVALGSDTTGQYASTITGGSGLTATSPNADDATAYTINVGAGTGITVNADDVQLKNASALTNDTVLGWDSSSGQLEVAPINYIGNTVLINSGIITTISGTQANFTGIVTATTFNGNATTATTATNVNGGFASVTNLTASGIATVGTGVGITQFSSSVSTGTSTSSVPTSSAVINYVGSQIAAVDLTITTAEGTNGTGGGGGSVATNQTFTFAGTTNEVDVTVAGQTVTYGLPSSVTVTTALTTPTVNATNIRANDGTSAITINNTTGNVSVASSLTVNGDLTVLGSQTVVNTTQLQVEDNLIDLGLVNSGGSLVAPTSDANIDVGVLFNYYTSSAKKAGIFWDDSTARIGIASDITITNNVVDTNTAVWAPIEIAALWLNDCAGQSQVIACSGGIRTLENITVDGGSF